MTDPASLKDPLSEDPLSGYIFMIVDSPSGEEDNFFVCAYSARTGLSYLGRPGEIES